MKIQPVTSIRITITAFIILHTVLVALSLTHLVTTTDEMYQEMALESARSLFKEITAARKWNALHNGVYLVVRDNVRPNPYLKDPGKNVITNSGVMLTKVNPAYMTRMISELMKSEHAEQLRITSLKPLNPANMPDPWERQSLILFDGGKSEAFQIIESKQALFRFMAPLKTEKSCLQCHAVQGYREGDIRGGISITIPFDNYRRMIAIARIHAVIRNSIIWVSGVALILLLGFMLVRSVKHEIAALSEVNTLRGFIPICSSCKKIRNDTGYWEHLEKYIEEHSDAQMSHGICPECEEKLYGSQEWYIRSKEKKEGK